MSAIRRWWFWLGFAAASLIVAGVVAHFASGSPDGLDAATLRGCEVVDTANGERLTGSCIAQHATEHAMAASPLAHYGGSAVARAVAGVLGVVVTMAVAATAFWLIARARRAPPES